MANMQVDEPEIIMSFKDMLMVRDSELDVDMSDQVDACDMDLRDMVHLNKLATVAFLGASCITCKSRGRTLHMRLRHL